MSLRWNGRHQERDQGLNQCCKMISMETSFSDIESEASSFESGTLTLESSFHGDRRYDDGRWRARSPG